MSELARKMARIIWWWMLRLMRTRFVRLARRWWLRHVPDSTARRMIRQDRFARRYGEGVLALTLTMLLASMAITGCYFLALAFVNSGLARPW